VESALSNLRRARALDIASIRRMPLPDLEQLIRPSGYFRQKAARLKTFIAYLDEGYGGSLNRMFAQQVDVLRVELLELNGVGPETADAILLYAGKLPVFVVDAYAKRVFERHKITRPAEKYEQVRELVQNALAHEESDSDLAEHFNEFHALLVEVGKRHCGTAAKCEGCPLQPLLPSQ
jgi:endonuclease-3 related protein